MRYLTADATTAGFVASFDLAEPALLEIIVAGADRRYRGSATMWAVPGMQLVDAPGFVVEIPGLAVTLKDVLRVKDAVEVVAHVTMMCGCPIDSAQTAKNPAFIPWPVNEFDVTAQLWLGHDIKSSAPMKLIATSQFTATVPLPAGIDSKTLTLWVTAIQQTAANVGAASFALG